MDYPYTCATCKKPYKTRGGHDRHFLTCGGLGNPKLPLSEFARPLKEGASGKSVGTLFDVPPKKEKKPKKKDPEPEQESESEVEAEGEPEIKKPVIKKKAKRIEVDESMLDELSEDDEIYVIRKSKSKKIPKALNQEVSPSVEVPTQKKAEEPIKPPEQKVPDTVPKAAEIPKKVEVPTPKKEEVPKTETSKTKQAPVPPPAKEEKKERLNFNNGFRLFAMPI